MQQRHELPTRKNSRLGSSKLMPKQFEFDGILSGTEQFNRGMLQIPLFLDIMLEFSTLDDLSQVLTNEMGQCQLPDFYNWNRVYVRYCDGASFTGDREAVDRVSRRN